MNNFSDITSRNELAEFLNVPIRKLTYVLYKKGVDNYYISFEIPKKNGGVRKINAPQGELKDIQKKLANALWEFQKEYIERDQIKARVSQAFEKKKGIITNAIVHKNKRIVLNLDLENFFDSFHFGRVRGYFQKNRYLHLPLDVATIIAQLTCYKGSLPQGAPSSPIITNLICNILDTRIVKVAKKYRVDYTRYADDLTFSTNDSRFLDNQEKFVIEVEDILKQSGFLLNKKKTRLTLRNSRQVVTGLVVNKKVNVPREYYKRTKAMAYALYSKGEFMIDGSKGTISQLEGRFAFINQLDRYNNKYDGKKKHDFHSLCSREKQYQKFLFYKYFWANSKPLISTEGKTDIIYLKSALKKYYTEYPNLIAKKDKGFEFKISFLRRTRRLEYFMGIAQDGANAMKNIYNMYYGNCGFPNFSQDFKEKYNLQASHPVILVFDNEQKSGRPLKDFLAHIKKKELLKEKRYDKIVDNLFVLTNPLVKDKEECEIEDLFDDKTLSHTIDGKIFSREENSDNERCYGKTIFADYIANNYQKIDFGQFRPMLDDINTIISQFKNFGGRRII